MNADHDFQIGKTHTVCEDYALSGVGSDGVSAYAIVSDGCSSSPDVDFGARAIAMMARELLIKNKNESTSINYQDFGKWTIESAGQIYNMFATLDRCALDATLLVCWVRDGIVTTYMYGDGVYLYTHEGKTHATHIEFTSGAPAYLSYQLNPKRMKAYDVEMIGTKNQTEAFFGSDTKGWVTQLKPFDPVIITHPVMEGDVVSVASDGINSFVKSNNDSIKWEELVKEYTGFKNYEGVFVKRRFAAFKRNCLKEGINHNDDISIASIVV